MTTRIEYARRRATALTATIEQEKGDYFQAQQMVGRLASVGITSGREYDAWAFEMQQSRQAAEAAQGELTRLQRAIAANFPPPTRPPPTGGGGGPPASNGKTVDPAALLSAIQAKPRVNVGSDWGASIVWKPGDPDMANARHFTTNGLAILNHGGVGPNGILATKQPDHRASNLELDGLGKVRWGFMGYGVPLIWEDCWAHDIKEEHVDYNKNCWNTTIKRWRADRIGSQFLQEVNRVHEMVNPQDIRDPYGNGVPSEVLVEDCALMDVGLPTGARPAYMIAEFEPQEIPGEMKIHRNVTVRGCHLETWAHPNYQASGGLAYSFGGIMSHCHRKVAILDTRVLMGWPDRAVIQLWEHDEVWIIGGETNDYWYGKTLEIDVRGKPGMRVVVLDHMGDWRLRVCGGNFWDYAYKFQDAQIAPFLKLDHFSKKDGQSIDFTIPA